MTGLCSAPFKDRAAIPAVILEDSNYFDGRGSAKSDGAAQKFKLQTLYRELVFWKNFRSLESLIVSGEKAAFAVGRDRVSAEFGAWTDRSVKAKSC